MKNHDITSRLEEILKTKALQKGYNILLPLKNDNESNYDLAVNRSGKNHDIVMAIIICTSKEKEKRLSRCNIPLNSMGEVFLYETDKSKLYEISLNKKLKEVCRSKILDINIKLVLHCICSNKNR